MKWFSPVFRHAAALLSALALVLLTGCACGRGVEHPFVPARDGFSYANELRWEYRFSNGGVVETQKTDPEPRYSLRCFPMVRAAREFFYHARFDPAASKASRGEYERIVSNVLARNSRCPSAPEDRISIPGYQNLHDFSADYGDLLKSKCGGALQSFFQRGNWRMVFPVTRHGQEKTAHRLETELANGQVPAVHIYRFPNTSLNHALLIYAVESTSGALVFSAYDPNDPARPAQITFDKTARTFLFERNRYFAGGPVKLYEVYRGFFY